MTSGQYSADRRGEGLSGAVRWALDPAPESISDPPAWRPWAAFALCLVGLGVSVYLTIAHFSSASILSCSDQGVVNCAKVTTSAESEVFGHLPVAVLGLAFFVVMAVLDAPMMWRVKDRRVHLLRLAATVVGMGFVLYLLAAELVIIGNICLWCTSVHVVTFLLFILTVATVPAMLGLGKDRLEEEW